MVQTGDRRPITDEWREIPTAGAPSAREGFPWVWTGTRLVVWGGEGGSGMLNTGGLFDPRQSIWSATPIDGNTPSPRGASHTAVWTGTEMLIWVEPMTTGLRSTTEGGYPCSRARRSCEPAFPRRQGDAAMGWPGCKFGLDATFDLLRGDLRTLPVGGPSEACLLGPGHSAGSAARPRKSHGKPWLVLRRQSPERLRNRSLWVGDRPERANRVHRVPSRSLISEGPANCARYGL